MRIGIACKLYYLTTGTRAAWANSATNGVYIGAAPANLALIGGVTDLDVPVEKDDLDASTRDSAYELAVGGLIKGPISFKLRKQLSNAGQAAMLAAMMSQGSNAEQMSLAILDGLSTVNGVVGWWLDAVILGMKETQPLKSGPVMFDVTIKPSGWSSVDPESVAVNSMPTSPF